MDGRPFFVVSCAVDPGLLSVLREHIAPRLKAEVPNQPTEEQLEADPLLSRFTIVFDREGYSPQFFAQMKEQRIAVLTYHKFPGEPWSEQEFRTHQVSLVNGEQVRMELAERGVQLSNDLWVREIRRLSEKGHQSSILCTDYGSDLSTCTPMARSQPTNSPSVMSMVHAWAAWRVYKMTGARGERDRAFLESVFQKLLINFTWWVNRKDFEGNNLFAGGFLRLDNIGVSIVPTRCRPAGFCNKLTARHGWDFTVDHALDCPGTRRGGPVYEDMASKFLELIGITDAMNSLGGTGLWDEQDGFYYDQLKVDGRQIPLRTRSLVGLIPLIAVEVIETSQIEKMPGFKKRMEWFLGYRGDLKPLVTYCEPCSHFCHRMLAIPTQERLKRALRYMLDENEFLSPCGLPSVSLFHRQSPYVFHAGNEEHRVDYMPGEGTSYLFGGKSNWRGPIWFPINYLIIEALERYDHFYGDKLKVECPVGSGKMLTLSRSPRSFRAGSRASSCAMKTASGPSMEMTRDSRATRIGAI
jgi:hypothetical protein